MATNNEYPQGAAKDICCGYIEVKHQNQLHVTNPAS
jgi:hypothetical protein